MYNYVQSCPYTTYTTVWSQSFEERNFRGWHRTSKIKLREILEYHIDANGILGSRKLVTQNLKIGYAKFLKMPIRENCAPLTFAAMQYISIIM